MTETTTGEATSTVAARAQELVKVYGKGEAEVRALDGVTVDLMKGEFTAIMGPSGSGKSTLMHCLAALDTPTSGEAVVDGTSLGRLKDKDLTTLRREKIGFVFQSFNLVPTLTAEENILLPLEPGRTQGRPGVVRLGDRRHRAPPAPGPPPQRDVRRAAAARRLRPGPGEPAVDRLRRRAHRQPRLDQLRRRCWASCAAASTSSARPWSW